MPVPAKHSTWPPSAPTGRILLSRRMFIITVGLSHSPRGTEPPVSEVFAPCGRTATPAAQHALRTAMASCKEPGFTTASAVPSPSREPLMVTLLLTFASSNDLAELATKLLLNICKAHFAATVPVWL